MAFCFSRGVRLSAFISRNTREPPPVAQARTGADTAGSLSGDHYPPEESRKQGSLVIEDYYRVSVEPPDALVTPRPFLVGDALERDSRKGLNRVEIPVPGHDSSFISEDEGPAQWLASPQGGLDHTGTMSMELAEDTSESDGERKNSGI